MGFYIFALVAKAKPPDRIITEKAECTLPYTVPHLISLIIAFLSAEDAEIMRKQAYTQEPHNATSQNEQAVFIFTENENDDRTNT